MTEKHFNISVSEIESKTVYLVRPMGFVAEFPDVGRPPRVVSGEEGHDDQGRKIELARRTPPFWREDTE